MAAIGRRNTLRIVREAPPGLYLDAQELGEVLLPRRYIPQGWQPGDDVDVFLYFDSEDRFVSSTEPAKAQVGEFACLEVVGARPGLGAFLDWGLCKDLLLPLREQEERPRLGDWVLVYVYIDTQTNRIAATSRIKHHLDLTEPKYTEGQAVELIVFAETPLGYKAIVDHAHTGLLYRTEISGSLGFGEKVPGFVRAVRPDGKIDLRLDASGYKRVETLADRILAMLQAEGGRLDFDDEATPEAIRAAFGTSKKAFKQALGALYRARKIQFANQGIELAR